MVYEIRKDVPIAENSQTGLCAAIRQMKYGHSIVIPAGQRLSIHSCARSVGARVKTRSNGDGAVTVWRIDEPTKIDRNIFGDPSQADAKTADNAPAGDIFK